MINIFDIDSNSNDIVKLLMVILRMEEILRHLGWLKPYINNGINHLSTDAGFLPSTVGYCFTGAEFTVPRLPQPLLIGS
jgi:hypothetical protein